MNTLDPAAADARAVDAIALLLGTAEEWSSPADYLEAIANVIGQVRPHPGDCNPSDYLADFNAERGITAEETDLSGYIHSKLRGSL